MGSPSSPPSMCLISVCGRRDLDALLRLRQTLRSFDPVLPHRVVVPQECLRLFRRRLQEQPGGGLVLLGTREVLPARAERGRRLAATPVLGRVLGPFARDLYLFRPRRAAQLVRIFTLAGIPEDFGVFLDPGLLPSQPVTAESFLRAGQPRLFEAPAETARQLARDISTHELLGTPLHRVHRLYDYGFAPAVFRRSTAVRLLDLLAERGERHWLRGFLQLRYLSEFNLLGFAARELEHYEGLHVEPGGPAPAGWSHVPPPARGRAGAGS